MCDTSAFFNAATPAWTSGYDVPQMDTSTSNGWNSGYDLPGGGDAAPGASSSPFFSKGMIGDAGLAMQAAGVVRSAFGAYDRATAAREGYNAQANVADVNATYDDARGRDAILRGQLAAASSGAKYGQLSGTQTAMLAARGLAITPGTSAWDTLADTEFSKNLDRATISDNAAKEKWGYDVSASNNRSNAAMLRWRAKQESPFGDAAGTFLTGAGSVASSWYKIKSGGGF